METERPCEKRGEHELFFVLFGLYFPLVRPGWLDLEVSCEGPGTLCRPR